MAKKKIVLLLESLFDHISKALSSSEPVFSHDERVDIIYQRLKAYVNKMTGFKPIISGSGYRARKSLEDLYIPARSHHLNNVVITHPKMRSLRDDASAFRMTLPDKRNLRFSEK